MIPTSVPVGPRSVQVPGNEACDSRPRKPKVHLNHQEAPGKGKLGWVNANEPSVRLRDYRLPKEMVDHGNDGSRAGPRSAQGSAGKDTAGSDTTTPQ